jgi:F-type H+-transporting ATPase subunit gamma
MAGLKEIRTRISSIKTTRQVTSAMKLVSASKLKKAQDAVNNFRPYSRNFNNILLSLISSVGDLSEESFFTPREPSKVLIILITSNRGLCGGFNANITNKALELAFTKYSNQMNSNRLHFLTIGKRGDKLLRNHKFAIKENRNDLLEKLTFEHASDIVNEIIEEYNSNQYDRIELIYNDFVNVTLPVPKQETFLPIQEPQQGSSGSSGMTLLEPSKEELIAVMIPMWLKIQFYRSLLVSSAAEHGARMTAMHQATDNATELLGDLTLQYNKARQAAITNEILEITGGSEALTK